MSKYGTTAKVIGMYKKIQEEGIDFKHVFICKSDLDKYLTISINYFLGYESFGRYGIMSASYVDLKIEIADEDAFLDITYLPIKEHFIDLISINSSNFKCEIFEISYNKEKYRIDDEFCCPRYNYHFNEDLFVEDLEYLEE
jgi:hypothetical protein